MKAAPLVPVLLVAALDLAGAQAAPAGEPLAGPGVPTALSGADGTDGGMAPSDAGGTESEPVEAPPSRKKARGKRTGEKEPQGTEAPNRFEADTVIKSQYQLNGEHLEVDPD